MIRLRLIPESGERVPHEATDHAMLAGVLEASANVPEQSPVSGWQSLRRVVPGHRRYIYLELDASMGDFPGNSLDAMTTPIVDAIPGVKAHPTGWKRIDR